MMIDKQKLLALLEAETISGEAFEQAFDALVEDETAAEMFDVMAIPAGSTVRAAALRGAGLITNRAQGFEASDTRGHTVKVLLYTAQVQDGAELCGEVRCQTNPVWSAAHLFLYHVGMLEDYVTLSPGKPDFALKVMESGQYTLRIMADNQNITLENLEIILP